MIVNQVISEYQAKESRMLAYLHKVKELLTYFIGYTITQVSREEKNRAYAFAKLASTTNADLTRLTPIVFLQNLSINHEESVKGITIKFLQARRDEWNRASISLECRASEGLLLVMKHHWLVFFSKNVGN